MGGFAVVRTQNKVSAKSNGARKGKTTSLAEDMYCSGEGKVRD